VKKARNHWELLLTVRAVRERTHDSSHGLESTGNYSARIWTVATVIDQPWVYFVHSPMLIQLILKFVRQPSPTVVKRDSRDRAEQPNGCPVSPRKSSTGLQILFNFVAQVPTKFWHKILYCLCVNELENSRQSSTENFTWSRETHNCTGTGSCF